jgi:hypothetical protein
MSLGIGGSLASYGMNQMMEGTQELGNVADQEARRNAANKANEMQARQGRQQLGATLGSLAGGAWAGAEYGSAAGPWGTLIGGIVGALGGNLF